MRIHLKIKADNQLIPFDHQQWLVGALHKWLGQNEEHGSLSLYSFSWLNGGRREKNGLRFGDNGSLFISAHNTDLMKVLIDGIQKDPTLFKGLSVSEIILQEAPNLSDRNHFLVASPIFIKRRVDDRVEHIVYDDPRANQCLEETFRHKMEQAGLHDDSLSIRFDTSYHGAMTKKVTYNSIENRANWCPVIIEGKPETKQFAWHVGLGNSTGIGFGAIK